MSAATLLKRGETSAAVADTIKILRTIPMCNFVVQFAKKEQSKKGALTK